MSTRQTLLMSFVIAVVCAAVVWYLERFERQKLRETWLQFVNELPDMPKRQTEGETS